MYSFFEVESLFAVLLFPKDNMDSVEAWKALRSPFPLTELTLCAHACVWESFDADKAGCLLCSHVHVCCFGHCARVVQTTDSLVCEITGLCIRKDNIINEGFSDQVISYGFAEAYTGDNKRVEMWDGIDIFVAEMLLSDTAKQVHEVERLHHIHKLTNSIQRGINKQSSSCLNLLSIVEVSLNTNKETKRYGEFDSEYRSKIAEECVLQLRSTLPICNKHLGMNIKRSDMRTAVFGLLFLMRSGINIHDICVLPCIATLSDMLPNESNLMKYFAFKSKNITEIENKFKFHLRHATKRQMHNMGFHLTRNGV